MKLAKKDKVQLIFGAAQRGPTVLVRQVWLALMDSLVRKRHLVFRLDGDRCKSALGTGQEAQRVRKILSPEDFQEELVWLKGSGDLHDWGAVEWLEAGWQLWLLEEDGQVQALAWVRDAAHSRDFFVPLNDREELLWHVYVLPQYRGRNLHMRLWEAVITNRMSEGVEGFFTNCRDYNFPSKLNILKMGFLPVGHCDECRFTGRRIWRGY